MNKFVLNGSLAAALFLSCVLPAGAQHFTQTNLVSDTGIGGTKKDPNLVNPWGMSRSSQEAWWFSDNNSNLSTLYTGDGKTIPLVVSVPGGPSGTIYNGTNEFQLSGTPAAFVFSTEDGTILAWAGGTAATPVASKSNAVYKGLAIATVGGSSYLYATDFRHGKIDVLDGKFHYVAAPGSECREREFSLGESYLGKELAPFNIQNIGGNLYVTYAKQDAAKHDDVKGAGLGLVAVFTPEGRLLRIFEHGNWLNAPWGLAEAPGDFGPFSHALLVGNFGSGRIGAYNEQTGKFLGLFEDASGAPIAIDGLWGLSFGNDAAAGNATVLYFTAGPNEENNGLFGKLTPVASDLTLGNGN